MHLTSGSPSGAPVGAPVGRPEVPVRPDAAQKDWRTGGEQEGRTALESKCFVFFGGESSESPHKAKAATSQSSVAHVMLDRFSFSQVLRPAKLDVSVELLPALPGEKRSFWTSRAHVV